jgi:integrase
MNRTKICILPKLYNCNGNAQKQWFVYYSYCNPANNKMTRFRVYDGFTECYTKKAKNAHAEKLIQEYTYRLQNGWNPFADNVKAIYEDNLQYSTVARVFKNMRAENKTFNYYTNLFLPEVKGMADKTYRNYVSKYRIFDAWLARNNLSGNDITSITPAIMRSFFLFLINDEQLARITIMKYRHMLERLFDWCVKSKYLKVSPCQDLPDTTRENDQAPRPINVADIDKLVNTIREKDRQLWLAVQLEYYCFLRPGLEIRMARVGWFDLARGTISVPKEVVKTDQNKIVIIPKQLREYLLEEWRLHLYPAHFFVFGQNGMPGTSCIGSNNMRNRFNVIRDQLKLPTTYKLYSWKHTGNARAADAGISMYDRQRQNGHSSMRSTEEYMKNKIGFSSLDLENNFPDLSKPSTHKKPATIDRRYE